MQVISDIEPDSYSQIKAELEVIRKVHCPYIVRSYEAFFVNQVCVPDRLYTHVALTAAVIVDPYPAIFLPSTPDQYLSSSPSPPPKCFYGTAGPARVTRVIYASGSQAVSPADTVFQFDQANSPNHPADCTLFTVKIMLLLTDSTCTTTGRTRMSEQVKHVTVDDCVNTFGIYGSYKWQWPIHVSACGSCVDHTYTPKFTLLMRLTTRKVPSLVSWPLIMMTPTAVQPQGGGKETC